MFLHTDSNLSFVSVPNTIKYIMDHNSLTIKTKKLLKCSKFSRGNKHLKTNKIKKLQRKAL